MSKRQYFGLWLLLLAAYVIGGWPLQSWYDIMRAVATVVLMVIMACWRYAQGLNHGINWIVTAAIDHMRGNDSDQPH